MRVDYAGFTPCISDVESKIKRIFPHLDCLGYGAPLSLDHFT